MRARAALHRRDGRGPAARAGSRPRRRRRQVMKRIVGMSAVIATALACSGGNGGGSDPTALTAPIAQNVTISKITILQALEITVMVNGDVALRGGTDAKGNPYTYPLVCLL